MSVISMANAALGRRSDYPPENQVPTSLKEISKAVSVGKPDNKVTTAMNVIVTYIPTEVLTLYVAILAAVYDPKANYQQLPLGVTVAFYAFLIATPITVWVAFAVKLKNDGKPLPVSYSELPVWEMCAGAIAYTAWAFALPTNPFMKSGWYNSSVAGVAVIVVATTLGLVSPLFQRRLGSR